MVNEESGLRGSSIEEARRERRTIEQVEWPLIGMTVEECAASLRVNPRTIRDLLTAGVLPGKKVGVSWRIEPDAIKAWLSERGAPTQEESETYEGLQQN